MNSIRILILCFGAVLCFSSAAQAKKTAAPERKPTSISKNSSWKVLARKVGQSEDFRAGAIRELRRMGSLSKDLREGLRGNDRPLALEVISALEIKSLIPDMIDLVPTDSNGFLILGLNSMVTEKNQKLILDTYLNQLSSKNIGTNSNGALMAMLEPMGRMGIKIPNSAVQNLKSNESPEVRSSLLYYVRMMVLRHRNFEHVEIVNEMTKASEYQIRLQAESISSEIASRKLVGR